MRSQVFYRAAQVLVGLIRNVSQTRLGIMNIEHSMFKGCLAVEPQMYYIGEGGC